MENPSRVEFSLREEVASPDVIDMDSSSSEESSSTSDDGGLSGTCLVVVASPFPGGCC